MRPILFETDAIEQLLMTNVIATMPDIKKVLGTTSNKTALRKMKQLSYLSSYSHGGAYYTLQRIARFDTRGLWCHEDVHFSKLGTLMSTVAHFVSTSDEGFFARELEEILHVGVKMTLARLIENRAIYRERVGNRFLYCSTESEIRKQQLLARNLMSSAEEELSDEARAAIVIFLSVLNEQERRLYAGVEAIKYGYGGDRFAASLLGMHPKTVARARKELLSGTVEKARVRRPGGGRKTVEKKHRESSKKSKH